MNTRWIWIILMAASLTVSAGCNNNKSVTASDDPYDLGTQLILPDPNPKIPDVPLPMGFELVEKRSRHFSAGDSRYIDHVYKGDADKFSVARFYRRYMPNTRWEIVTDRFLQGTLTLVFHKGPEECTISITGDDGLFRATHVMVQVLWTGEHLASPMENPASR